MSDSPIRTRGSLAGDDLVRITQPQVQKLGPGERLLVAGYLRIGERLRVDPIGQDEHGYHFRLVAEPDGYRKL